MPRICPKCGAQIPAGFDSCPVCSKTPEDDVQIYTPRAAAPVQPKSSKRRVLAAALCAAVLAGGGLTLWRLSRENTPEKTAEEFRAALADGDFARLCAVAEPSGETAFTEESLAPMFSLYRESAAFRQQAAELASTDSACLHVEKRGGFPFATYRVRIDPCRLNVTTNVAGASVSAGDEQTASVATELSEALDGAGYTQDALNLVRSEAAFDTLLPGLYDVEVSYTTAFGQSFDAADTVSLFQPAQVSLDLDYTSLYVWNSSSMRVDLSVDGAYCTTLAAGASLQLAPLHADSVVTASCTTDAGETLTSSVTAASRSFEVLFSLGTVDVYNDYNADMLVRLNGADYCTIPAQTLQTIDDISLGSTLSFTLTGEEVFSPYDYQLIYDYDSICPILDLSEDAELAVSAVLQDELTTAPLTGEDSGLLGGFDRLLLENGWSRSEVVVSDVTVENVYAMNLVDGGILLGVSGYYTCTNISLPTADAQSQASAESPQDSEVPQESPQDGDDAQQLDAASAPAFEPIQNPQLQSFYSSVFFDGESWSVAE